MGTSTAALLRAEREAALPATVGSIRDLLAYGWTNSEVRAQLAARRWQRIGRAVVRHNGHLDREELCAVALVNLGPRAELTSFTALERRGLVGWDRRPVHVLVPRGARVRRPPGVQLRIHYTDSWAVLREVRRGPAAHLAHAALLATASFATARPACGLLAATVQQRLVRPSDLLAGLELTRRIRHRKALLAATHDIAQGAHALSEIDFFRLCRAGGLPVPELQTVRPMPGGRRRYLDATWRRRDGRRVVAEVDGALHLIVGRWWDDQLRQNELAIADDIVLRFPTVVLRHEPGLVRDQLGRALQVIR